MFGQQRRGDDRQCGVLVSRRLDGTRQPVATFNDVLERHDASGRKQLFHYSRLDLQALFVSDESNKKSRESNMRDFLGLLKAISWEAYLGPPKGTPAIQYPRPGIWTNSSE
jgi:hypothetical protein